MSVKRAKKAVVIGAIVTSSALSMSFVEDYYFEVSKNLDIFTTLFRDVNTYYVDSVQPGDLMKKGIDAMLGSLDPYTVFIPESDIEDYRMTHVSSEYGGIGALVHQRNGAIEISEVYEGFPAHKANLKPGDRIISVNGNTATGRKVDDVTNFMKGQKGTTVRLMIQREGVLQPFEVAIVRDEIKFKNVPYYGMLDNSTGYIKLTQFLEHAAEDVRQAFVSLKQNPGMKNLVLDLRGNGGGLLREAVDIVNLFVDKGQKVVSQRGKVKEMNMEYFATKTAVDTEIPIVVLVDRGSASASEIVSGAIQELDRGVVIGQRTFGKGLVQQTYNLSYNTLLKVTIAKYYTPSGRCIQALDYTHKTSDGLVTKVPDSLINEFKTKNNRSVFDGSGIFPDIYTEPKFYSSITIALLRNFHIFDYANKFERENKSIASAKDFLLTEAEYERFISYLSDKEYEYKDKSESELEEFKKMAAKEKRLDKLSAEFSALEKKYSEHKKQDLRNMHDEIKEILEAEISKRYYFQKGRIETAFRNDREIKKAKEIFSNASMYASILRGDASYKVIGKPGSEAQLKATSDLEVLTEDMELE
ncbi:MAG: PDZ domain-containing protein [Bacteroidetes bacterium]|nr:MAG: PDZ domain-containing protein [Bacteroidota bacterium]REK06679.1 MAG: PDZ domain-containing protein [Bacteroidota bacterium]REK33444.1 MAG: PDZ domain-containing protein [Bacteroidota bacterium]REK49837.1 MAG: PDZ domain-containing protein [Bacteroidota bacterium]